MSAGPLPSRWLKCPRKSLGLVGGKFLAVKTPLDERFNDQVPPECLWTPQMVEASLRSYKVKIGLWIDLTNTKRFYKSSVIEDLGIQYVKMYCKGHSETPTEDQVRTFVSICQKFISLHPMEIIVVHCTHGFNRTGFMISAYLIEQFDWSVDAAYMAFRDQRPPGMYKEEYINELFNRYGDISDAPAVPDRPEWCFEDEIAEENADKVVDDDGNDVADDFSPNKRIPKGTKVPIFMEGVPGIEPVIEQPSLGRIQRRFKDLCLFRKNGFPGAQPVSMDRDNMNYLKHKVYKVSWKADGTRYMMLIDGKNSVFFADRDNSIFKADGMCFPYRKDESQSLTGTVLDGEMVLDNDPATGMKIPRYLIYDIISLFKDGKQQDVGNCNFNTRLECIQREIVNPRNKLIQEGQIHKESEPFRIRIKQFWDITETKTLLGPKFTKEQLGHEPDGLIFQPVDHKYQCGQDDQILKWKPMSHNSVDFKLIIHKETRAGMIPKTIGALYVGNYPQHIAEIKLNHVLRQLNNKIIECKWDYNLNCWVFMRERTDKSFPNSYKTAQGVMKSINEPVTEDMLMDIVNQIVQNLAHRKPQKRPLPQNANELMPPPPPKFPRS